MEIKITTYNIHSCIGTDNLYSADRIATVIQGDRPDIVCLQEVEVNNTPTKTRIWSQYHEDDQPALIAAKTGLKYHVFVPAIHSKAESNWKERHQNVFDLDVSGNIAIPAVSNLVERQPLHHNVDSTTGKFGIAILSKFPILQIRTHYYKRYKKKTQRNAMACLIELSNKKLVWVVNTHLGCHFIGREQAHQSKELVLFIHSLEKRSDICGVILCGDFNSPPWYYCIGDLKRHGLQDVWQHSRKFEGTFPSHEQVFRIPKSLGRCFRKLLRLDYIFLDGGIVCNIAYVYDNCSDESSLASDHLPVCAVLLIDDNIARQQK
jgi:endonuclease/exonuclease/phosphatase family metal-dependent hydrolase